MSTTDQFLGIVRNGKFHPLSPKTSSDMLTSIQMQESVPPESGELNLAEYEGSTIMVQGHDGGDWIYSAMVDEQAGPILTAVVLELFGTGRES